MSSAERAEGATQRVEHALELAFRHLERRDRTVLEMRLADPPSSDRARGRALGLLIRRGYELELAHEAVRAFERGDAAERHPAEIAPIVPSYYDPEQRPTGP